MTVEEAIIAIEDYYLKLFKPRVERLHDKMSRKEVYYLCKEILDITKDKTVDGIPFPVPANTKLEGRKVECVVDTVLDTRKPSLVYIPYRQIMVCCNCLISLIEHDYSNPHAKWIARYELPFEKPTFENCIAQLKVVSEQFHGKGGAFEQAKILAAKGEWARASI